MPLTCFSLKLQWLFCFFSRGKMKRIVFQFTPYSWVKFEWKPASSLRRWLAVCGIIFVVRTLLWHFSPLLLYLRLQLWGCC